MLRAVRLDNFVKIKEDHLLSFSQDGVYFFVGENGAGKSSIFEAIRRCLSQGSNTSFSRVPNKSKPAYIICEYEIPEQARISFSNSKKLFTSFIRLPDPPDPALNLKYQYAKTVILGNDDISQNGNVFVELIERENESHEMKHYTCVFQADEEIKLKGEILKELSQCTNDSNESKEHVKSLLKCIESLIAKRDDIEERAKEDREDETTDAILRKLDDSVAFTFGPRSLGRVQWSKSPQLAKEYRTDNYKCARDKSEIIKYFLSEEKSEKYDKRKADEIFRMLTDGADYAFETKDTGIIARLDGEPVEVLKISEGILEAKYLSLLLTSKEFVTIFLEEPDRGMHPQMIQMIRDTVFLQVKEKTIITVSHNPMFIAPWSIPRTYKFYKKQSEKDSCRIIDVGKIAEKNQHRIPRLLASEEYACMLFARRVIFVEGPSDALFVKAIIAHILNPSKDDSTKKVLKLAIHNDQNEIQEPSISEQVTYFSSMESVEDILTKLRAFLASLHVVKLNGEKNKMKFHSLCKELGLSRLFLLDRDAVVKVKSSDACSPASDLVKSNIKRVTQEDEPQDNIKLKGLKTDVPEDADEDPSIYNRTADDREKRSSSDPQENIKEVTIPNKNQCIVSKSQNDHFEELVNGKDWKNAIKCLETDGVFVWRQGSLEDAFKDLVINFAWDDVNTKNEEQTRRYTLFDKLGINLSHSTEGKKKIYMNDKVSDEHISKSVFEAFNLCGKKSDITQLLRFLMMCVQGKVTLTPWTKDTS